ncbi:BZ3500_MvSof-1268-A1-R1_Chr2-1g04388 [Microbotryum saponariae]|uniref:BZ3500_MvSof-1268-A1-R1_Chr2-1g04388 protein n=1 Tax=Microbotryum saponariae TaxID=289078 RepID=A0A2X0KDY1_9BASI|nr:BZ3500_MvSof-1268-A1-R1_Chr2-1g04388 [Microbotryum saponariae]SCZ91602.1 BZ3501_MvSof-1269-A2-R1_Chr2-1g04044 [Microbotryum saponariae]
MAITKHVKIAADDPSLLPSDDDDDDFTLDDDADGAGSSGSDSDSDDDRASKRNKTSHVEQAAEPSLTEQDVDDLWASFNSEPDPYATPSTSNTTATTSTATATASTPHNDSTKSSTSATKSSQPKTIKIQVEYKFVGETVISMFLRLKT